MPNPTASAQKAVILGAWGFIGINLARALGDQGFELYCFARQQSSEWPAESRAIIGDLANPPAELLTAMDGALVFHLISSTRPTATTDHAALELQENLVPTVALLEATKDISCRWIYASSGGTVYGQTDADRISETHPTNPISSYGVGKLAAEGYFRLYSAIHGVDVVIARISNPYGPYQSSSRGQGLVATLLQRIADRQEIEIWGDGENVRDYIFIEDTVDALIALAKAGHGGCIYNVGTGVGTSIKGLISSVGEVCGRTPRVAYLPARRIDVRRNVLDTARIRSELGWQPRRDLPSGIFSDARLA